MTDLCVCREKFAASELKFQKQASDLQEKVRVLTNVCNELLSEIIENCLTADSNRPAEDQLGGRSSNETDPDTAACRTEQQASHSSAAGPLASRQEVAVLLRGFATERRFFFSPARHRKENVETGDRRIRSH